MLNELKVLELASVLAGPSVGQFFAELGAEVIKIENLHTGGDVTRTWKLPGENTDDRSSYFCSVNWGKKSIALDLNTPEGRTIVYDLAKKSDIVVASYKPGDAEKLGVDYDALSALNPQLIYGQITGFGSGTPRVGYDAVIQAEAGFMFMNGEPQGSSLKMPVALMDVIAAHHLKEGILLAMLQKGKTGKGDFIEVSLLQAAIASLANQATNWLVAGMIPQKQGSAHPNIAPYGDIFTTADGHEILLAVGSDRQFQTLCSILGKADLATEPEFRVNASRVKNRISLNVILSDLFKTRLLNYVTQLLLDANIPYGILRNMQEVFSMNEAQSLLIHSEDRIGVKTFVASNFQSTSSHFLPPPHFGEHTKEILLQSLEMPIEDVNSLLERHVII
ncbi:CaiB/BaiF CoA-transferase family protein [Chryseolinea sp. H1M3-3]|uniref:CaiB/BaiF CoA transferase family protein n=1 Tax=Chryseolinea sp. H1M3-3 TaxID=3034144 RepID=UPI0023EBC43A|nr:CaiB/BaiF CoA-transferase family protein [Chryseolinea sp. H1M3-3]